MTNNPENCSTCDQPVTNCHVFGPIHSNAKFPAGIPQHLDHSGHTATVSNPEQR
jgi:hypothetical protein